MGLHAVLLVDPKYTIKSLRLVQEGLTPTSPWESRLNFIISLAMVQPNHGASVPDIVAIGDERENVTQWRERCGIKKQDQIRLVKLAHMRYQHPDLDQITTFLEGRMEILQYRLLSI